MPKRDSIAFDFIHRNNTVCWISHASAKQPSLESFIPVSSQSKSELMCTNVSESSSENRILSFHSWSLPQPDMFDFNTVNHIAVDWLSNNWYFLDDTRELVLLCGLRFIPAQFLCKVVLSVGISKPRGITLDPNEGLMYQGTEGWHVDGNTVDLPHTFTVIHFGKSPTGKAYRI